MSHSNDFTRLDITNIKDGDTISGTVTVTNTGTLDSDLTLEADTADGDFINPDLNLQLLANGTEIYNGPFQDVDDAGVLNVGRITAEDDSVATPSATVEFIVTLNEKTDNSNEDKAASASFTWVSTQLEGETIPFVSTFSDVFGIGE